MERTARVLIGRNAEMGRLLDAFEAAEHGEGRVVVLEGEAGIGKTRLLQALKSQVQEAAPDAVVATGQGVELSGGAVPYGVVAGMLQNLVAVTGADWVRESLGGRVQDIGDLVPSLVARTERKGPLDRLGLYSAVHQLLVTLAKERVVVLLVEDLQWADGGSLDLLGFVAAAGAGSRLLVVVTVRPLKVLASAPAQLVTQLARRSGGELVSLGALAEDEAREQIAQAAVGAQLDERTVRAILDRAEGIPLYLEEIAALAGSGSPGATGALPTTLQLAVTSRLRSLSSSDRRVLDAAAVHEEPFAVDLLAHVTGFAESEIVNAADRAVTLGVLDEVGPDRYRFHHALQRQAVEEALSARQRTLRHRAWAEAIAQLREADGTGDRAGIELVTAEAHHWRAADDGTRALAAAATAASAAGRIDSPREAAFQLQHCVELWTRVEDPAAVAGMSWEDLLQSLIEAQRTGGDFEATIELLDQVETGAWSARPLAAAWIDVQRRYADFCLGNGAVAGSVHEDVGVVLDLVRDEPPSALLLDLLCRLWWDQKVGRYEYAERLAARIEAVAAEVSEATTPQAVLSRAVDRAIWHDDWDSVHQLCSEAIAEGLLGTDLLGAEVSLVHALTYLGFPTEAVALGERALRRIPHRDAAPESWDDLQLVLADAHELLGHYTDSLDHLAEIVRLTPSGIVTGAALAQAARVELTIGNMDRATAFGHESRAILPPLAGRNTSAGWTAGPVLVDALACARAGRSEEALAHLRSILSVPDVVDDPQLNWRFVLEAARLLSAPDPVTVELVREVAAKLVRIGRFGKTWTVEVAACLARYDGLHDPEQWRVAVTAWADIPAPAHSSAASVGLAEALLRTGNKDEARQTFEEALATAVEIGAVTLADTIRKSAARAGVRLAGQPTEAPSRSFALTTRELEVLELLAEGRTNDQIGRALFMSPRTASVHVSRILAKLGVTNRTEAAAKAGREGLLAR